MACSSRTVEGVWIIDLEGEIDLYKSPEVRSEISRVIAKKNKSVAINFQKVTYIDSSGLATMIDAFQKMKAYGGTMALVSMTKPVRSVFEVARLDKFFQIFEEETLAIASFQKSPESPA